MFNYLTKQGLIKYLFLFVLVISNNCFAHSSPYTLSTKIKIDSQEVEISAFLSMEIYRSIMSSNPIGNGFKTIPDYFKTHNSIEVDGIKIPPKLKDIKFIMVPNESPDIKVILIYPLKSKPNRVSIIWKTIGKDFLPPGNQSENISKESFKTIAELISFDQPIKMIVFTPEEPEYTWHSEDINLKPELLQNRKVVRKEGLKLPFFNFSESRVEIPNHEQAEQIARILLNNIYLAFDYKNESDIYDILVQSVDKQALASIYNQIYHSLVMQREGGAISRVHKIKIKQTEFIETKSTKAVFQIKLIWQVEGFVKHWGHYHYQTNEYQGIFDIAAIGDIWKIIRQEILQQKRVL